MNSASSGQANAEDEEDDNDGEEQSLPSAMVAAVKSAQTCVDMFEQSSLIACFDSDHEFSFLCSAELIFSIVVKFKCSLPGMSPASTATKMKRYTLGLHLIASDSYSFQTPSIWFFHFQSPRFNVEEFPVRKVEITFDAQADFIFAPEYEKYRIDLHRSLFPFSFSFGETCF